MFGWVTTKLLGYVSGGLAVALAITALWGWNADRLRAHWHGRYDREHAEYAAFRAEIVDRTAQALAEEKEKAHAADISYKAELADARAAAHRYITAHRVRTVPPGGSAAAAPADSGVHEEPAANAVLVSEADVIACTEASQYAMSAYLWANGGEREER